MQTVTVCRDEHILKYGELRLLAVGETPAIQDQVIEQFQSGLSLPAKTGIGCTGDKSRSEVSG